MILWAGLEQATRHDSGIVFQFDARRLPRAVFLPRKSSSNRFRGPNFGSFLSKLQLLGLVRPMCAMCARVCLPCVPYMRVVPGIAVAGIDGSRVGRHMQTLAEDMVGPLLPYRDEVAVPGAGKRRGIVVVGG